MIKPNLTKVWRLAATIEGHVQGVGFRYFVLDQANRLELRGWVRNRYSGEVEVVAEGNQPALEQLLDALHRGPGSALVASVNAHWQAATGEFNRFRIAPTE